MEITETFYPKDPGVWRVWLEKHHDIKKEIWVVFYKKSTGKQSMTYQEALDEAHCFGWVDGMEKTIDSERFTIRFSPRSSKSAWSTKNVKRYSELLKEGKTTKAGESVFAKKSHVYPTFAMKKGAIDWHLAHKMPKNPTLDERIVWHKEHQKYCGCRPVPKSLLLYLKGN